MPIWRIAAAAALISGYLLVSYLAMAHWPDRPWAIALLFGPLLIGLGVAGAARRHGPTLGAALGLAALLVAIVVRGGIGIQPLYVAQHAAIHALLAFSFGITLRPGATPAITLIAERVHEHFGPEQRVYARRLTVIWTVYFIAMIVVSLALYAWTSWAVWSVFCNFVTPGLAAAFFVGEHVLRYRLHPEFERVKISAALRAYRSSSASAPR